MNKVRLYYIKHQGEHDLAQIDALQLQRWLDELSAQKRASILRLLHLNNRMSSLLGLRLLTLCAQDAGIKNFRLRDIHYPETGKPCWTKNNDTFDFNISHSANLVLLAASTTSKVGVDVERIRALKRLGFKMVMSPDELAAIQQQPALFFDLWSKKEAVVKAADTSGLARMRDITINDNEAVLDDTSWQLQALSKPLGLEDEFAIHLASSVTVDELIVKQFSIKTLME